MLATVPLSSPVKTVIGAQALAESIAFAEADAMTGPAIDRIMLFLRDLPFSTLMRETPRIVDVLHLLSEERADRATDWLARHVEEETAAFYWTNIMCGFELSLAA